jgi:hypothetical protein
MSTVNILPVMPRYLYVARNQTSLSSRKHHVFKVGHSSRPYERIQDLGGSGSTDTYEAILVLPLPRSVKDSHVLSHRLIQPFVIHRHERLQKRYLSIFGACHADGIRRRRELVMFGSGYSTKRVMELFRQVVASMSSRAKKNGVSSYVCTDASCIASGRGLSLLYCDVCTKYVQSSLSHVTYHRSRLHAQRGSTTLASKVVRMQTKKRLRQAVADMDATFSSLLQSPGARRVVGELELELELEVSSPSSRSTKRRRVSVLPSPPIWEGPAVDAFWIMRPDADMVAAGHRFLLGLVKSNDVRKRSSLVQWWSPVDGDDPSRDVETTVDLTFHQDTRDGLPYKHLDELAWDHGGWQSCIRMKSSKRKGQRSIWEKDKEMLFQYVVQWEHEDVRPVRHQTSSRCLRSSVHG